MVVDEIEKEDIPTSWHTVQSGNDFPEFFDVYPGIILQDERQIRFRGRQLLGKSHMAQSTCYLSACQSAANGDKRPKPVLRRFNLLWVDRRSIDGGEANRAETNS
jgi:hypothetical protein